MEISDLFKQGTVISKEDYRKIEKQLYNAVKKDYERFAEAKAKSWYIAQDRCVG